MIYGRLINLPRSESQGVAEPLSEEMQDFLKTEEPPERLKNDGLARACLARMSRLPPRAGALEIFSRRRESFFFCCFAFHFVW